MVRKGEGSDEVRRDKLDTSRSATLRTRLVREWERLHPICMRDPRTIGQMKERIRESRIANILARRYDYKPWVR